MQCLRSTLYCVFRSFTVNVLNDAHAQKTNFEHCYQFQKGQRYSGHCQYSQIYTFHGKEKMFTEEICTLNHKCGYFNQEVLTFCHLRVILQ